MNELSTQIRRSICPSPQTREQADDLARIRNRLTPLGGGKYTLPHTVAPDDEARRAMAARVEEIHAGMAPAPDSEIDFLLSSLFMAFPSVAAPQISVYRAALRGMPTWAIRLSCSAFVTGRAGGNLAFAPSAPQLRADVEARVAVLKAEAWDIGKILAAQIVHEPSPEERKRVLDGLGQLAAEVAAAGSMDAAIAPPKQHPWMAEREEIRRGPPIDHGKPVKLSAWGRRATGLPPLPIEDAPPHEESI